MSAAEGPPEDCRVEPGELSPENVCIWGEGEGGFEQTGREPLLPK